MAETEAKKRTGLGALADAGNTDDFSVIDAIGVVGLVAHGSTPQEMLADQKAEYERWGPLVKQIGITSES